MEIDKNYLQYVVAQEVAKATAELQKTIGKQQEKLLDKMYNLEDRWNDILPEHIKAPYGRNPESGKPMSKEEQAERLAQIGERWQNK